MSGQARSGRGPLRTKGGDSRVFLVEGCAAERRRSDFHQDPPPAALEESALAPAAGPAAAPVCVCACVCVCVCARARAGSMWCVLYGVCGVCVASPVDNRGCLANSLLVAWLEEACLSTSCSPPAASLLGKVLSAVIFLFLLPRGSMSRPSPVSSWRACTHVYKVVISHEYGVTALLGVNSV